MHLKPVRFHPYANSIHTLSKRGTIRLVLFVYVFGIVCVRVGLVCAYGLCVRVGLEKKRGEGRREWGLERSRGGGGTRRYLRDSSLFAVPHKHHHLIHANGLVYNWRKYYCMARHHACDSHDR